MMLSRGGAILIAKLAISIGLICLIGRNVDLTLALNAATRLDSFSTSALLLLAFIQVPCLAYRWEAIIKALDLKSTSRDVLRLTFIGIFFNQVLPTAFGGDAVKAWYLHRHGALLKSAIISVLLDRTAALCVVIAMALVLLPALGVFLHDQAVFWSLATSIILIGFAILLTIFAHEIIARLLRRWKFLSAFAEFIQYFGRVFSSRSIGRPILWSLVTQFLSITIVYLLAWNINIPLTYWQCLVVLPVVFLGASLPISYAGWGAREGGMVFMLGFIGISGAEALALSVIFGLLMMCVSTVGGLVWLMTRDPRPKLVLPSQN